MMQIDSKTYKRSRNNSDDNKENFHAKLEEAGKFRQEGISIATQALSSCLLQPKIELPDAVATVLRRSGGSADSSDQAVMSLRSCMKRKRWCIQWQTIELLCSAALSSMFCMPAQPAKRAKVDILVDTQRTQSERTCGEPLQHAKSVFLNANTSIV